MSTATINEDQACWPDDEHFGRNFIGGRWIFPAAPYDFEIRDPADSTIITVVPLSSRFDVGRAVAAARSARTGAWSNGAMRARLLDALLDRLDTDRAALARLQSRETGLAFSDSLAAVQATVSVARAVIDRAVLDAVPAATGVSGHVLSWGLPLTEVVTSTVPVLLRGDTVVVKPSLRAPLSAVAFARLAQECGLPPGTVNIVQGTGVDVGAELFSRQDLSALYVRGGERSIANARRAQHRTGVPSHVVRSGGNVCITGPGQLDAGELATAVAAGVRMHAGPFGLPLLALHRDAPPGVLETVLERLTGTVAAPLPTEPLRARALARLDALTGAGASVLLGGRVPDDVTHRMGWRIPPTVLMLGEAGTPAARCDRDPAPLGPLLSVLTWDNWPDLAQHLSMERHRQGVAAVWGTGLPPTGTLPTGVAMPGGGSGHWPAGVQLPAAWMGDES
jgi:acyl-CoA reductase-like NAD-dependent aldehyde dehydrogenase